MKCISIFIFFPGHFQSFTTIYSNNWSL